MNPIINGLLWSFVIFSFYFIISTIVTLWMFLVIMKWKQEGMTTKNASWWQKAFFSIGVICDSVYNYTSGAVILLQWPRAGEVMFTYHLQRIRRAMLYKSAWQKYRYNVAGAYCYVIELFDVKHCTK